MKERLYEKDLRVAVESAGGLCLKLPSRLYRGIPDRLILLPGGRVFFVELKAERGRTSKVQSAFRTFLRSIGFNSEVIRGKQEVEEFIQEHVSKR